MSKWLQMIAYILMIVLVMVGWSCSEKKPVSDGFKIEKPARKKRTGPKASTHVDLVNKGVGAIQSVDLPDEVDPELVKVGQAIFDEKCTLCHRVGEVHVGPDLQGLLDRRAPEWAMNMMLDPDLMIKSDSLAKALFLEFKGYPMTNQKLTREDARAVLEFLRD